MAVILIGVLASITLLIAHNRVSTPPRILPHFYVDLDLSAAPPLNATANVRFVFAPDENLGEGSAWIELGDGLVWISGENSWNGKLIENVHTELRGIIKSTKTGISTISGHVLGGSFYAAVTQSIHILETSATIIAENYKYENVRELIPLIPPTSLKVDLSFLVHPFLDKRRD